LLFGVSPLAEEYRRKAKVAEAIAEAMQDRASIAEAKLNADQRARDLRAKEDYLKAAERWRQLGDWAERHNW
jgi:hypothetical protein